MHTMMWRGLLGVAALTLCAVAAIFGLRTGLAMLEAPSFHHLRGAALFAFC
jgi:hypothetical protein